jgi:hypothetical protein
MATLATHVSRLPLIWQRRYQDQWISWANDLLECLGSRGLLAETRKEIGVVVSDDYWIDKPSDFRNINKVFDPENRDKAYRASEVNGKIRLADYYVTAEESPTAATTFSAYATTYITGNFTGLDANEAENYLLVITAGTYAGRTYVIKGNDATGSGSTKLFFLHTLDTALDGTKVTAAYITSPDYYLMLDYQGSYTELAALSEEIPMPDAFERRVTEAWLRWKAEENASSVSQETMYWQNQTEKILMEMQGERFGRVSTPARGRTLVGFTKGFSRSKEHPNYEEF